MMQGNTRKKYQLKYHQPCDFGVPFWSLLHDCFPLLRVFVSDLFFGTFAGTPTGDFGHLLEGFCPPWARLNPPFWNDVGIQRRFLVHPPFPRTCLSSETVGQIRKCYSNTSQTHDAIKAFNLSK
jgi:hypothetical protein